MKRLYEIQQELKVPKDLHNSFGGYNYRSCESILETVKPLLNAKNLVLTMSDDVAEAGGQAFVKATICLIDREDGKTIAITTACARNAETKKGMDAAQITGAASSYARKYALCGMFAIDDSKADPDAADNREAHIELINENDQKIIRDALHSAGLSESELLAVAKIGDLGELAVNRMAKLLAWVQNNSKAGE